MRSLAALSVGSQEPLVVETRIDDPQVHFGEQVHEM